MTTFMALLREFSGGIGLVSESIRVFGRPEHILAARRPAFTKAAEGDIFAVTPPPDTGDADLIDQENSHAQY
jgi:hypothetical protein